MSTINLLPEDYLRRRWQSRANALCVILTAVVMASVGTAALVSEQSLRNTRQIRDKINASYAEAAKMLTEMQKLEATKRQMIIMAKSTALLLERVPRSYVLALVAQALPEHCSLIKVELKPSPKRQKEKAKREPRGSKFAAVKRKKQKLELAVRTQPPMRLEVTGHAATDVQVGHFIKNLHGNPLLSSVDLNFSQDKVLNAHQRDKPKCRIREFKVTMELRPNVDVIDFLNPDRRSENAKAGTEATTGKTES